ncbi:unnamed protein product, partial [Iphiclides podalirius]
MYGIWFVVFLVACLLLTAEGQLTFTSSWGGKRSMGDPMLCRNNEAIANIYKSIKNEAERMLLCQRLS